MSSRALDERALRVLLVEDNPGDARLLQEELREFSSANIELVHVDLMAEALRVVETARVDAVLLDLSLPDGAGLGNISRLLQAAPATPLVVLTGTDDERLAVQAVHEGAQDYLVKGQVTGPLLVRALRYAIERKRVEEGLKREEAARQTAVFREQFLGILGHDLRNPLQAISGNAALLLRYGGLAEPQRKAVNRISISADRMARMINDLLDFTRTRLGGGYALSRTRMNLHEVVRQVVEELEVAHPKRQFELGLSGNGWGEWDADRIAQAVSNLVGNAVQYSPEDTAVSVSLRDQEGGVRLEVHNWGLPIPAERLPHIFDPFVRAGDMRSAQRNGLGLGLYITHEIVRAHGGLLRVTSTAQGGTRFCMDLPRHVAPAAAVG
ncbi:hybrid sensor histidine kinase/response regulator [Pyxidicoccus fallax]|uniref:histidine kinase n=1 Tax=Pyxidicoccus fallax TaxID=394095 RepID=A0A848LCT4_9BACT|nr:hybrid sensor histidine kinase/response regulator [Pyxidicoccus fallax]NMO16890.1 hybrid sensor histidine kinase/response regulator [Pyxidicoccus fallax]NPC82696.1 hybrid sensor histidine kinase/response regulator [Pyxidicoccus fallax]